MQVAFEIIGVISVITNCALIGMDPEVQKLLPSDITAVNTVIILVAVEVSGISLVSDTIHVCEVLCCGNTTDADRFSHSSSSS
jgi:spore maturation protein SpmA